MARSLGSTWVHETCHILPGEVRTGVAALGKNWQYLENAHVCTASSVPVVVLGARPSEFLVHFRKEAHDIFFTTGKEKKRETTQNPLTGYR